MLTEALQADKEPSLRTWCLLGAGFFLLLWAQRLAGLHPAFHPDDSPEISAAMAGLGIPHPPGYPLPTLLGRLASLGLPGAPAFATNALAALFSALGVLLALGLLAPLLDLRQKSDRLWLAVAALGLATLPQLWFQGLSSKGGFYTLNLCLTLGAVLCLQGGRNLGLGWLLVGLGLANHYMSLLLFLPALTWWSWQARPGLGPQAKLWALGLPGLALYLYLPLRSGFDPAMDWGDPQTWPRFWDVVLRRMYRGAESGQDLDNALHLGRHFLALWQEQWHWLGLGLALAGLPPLWRKGPAWRPLLAALGLHLAVVLAYNNPPRHAPWVINAFFLPTFALAAVPLLMGVRRLQAALPVRLGAGLPWALSLALLAALPGRWHGHNFRHDHLLYDYAQDLLLVPAKGAALLAAGGNDAFPVWYLQQLQGRRRDLCLVDVPLISDWYLEQLRPCLAGLDPAWRSRDQVVQGLLASPRQPLYYSSHNPGDRGIPLGMVSLVPVPGQALTLSSQGLLDPWKAVRYRWATGRLRAWDGNREELLGYYPASARALADFGRRQGVPPLAQAGERLAQRLQGASRPPSVLP